MRRGFSLTKWLSEGRPSPHSFQAVLTSRPVPCPLEEPVHGPGFLAWVFLSPRHSSVKSPGLWMRSCLNTFPAALWQLPSCCSQLELRLPAAYPA